MRSDGHAFILGMRVDRIEAEAAAQEIAEAALARRHGRARAEYVCAANVHMTMVAHDDVTYRRAVNESALVVADGQPMVWALRAMGVEQRERVRVTPDLLDEVFARASEHGLRIGLYGGTSLTLDRFRQHLAHRYPGLNVVYAWAPPFRPLTSEEDAREVGRIRKAAVELLLVGIGCPKQERWMAAHSAGSGSLPCLMMGVGAAFDLFGGKTRNAPKWMQRNGLEWLYRLAHEPGRLWRRHLFNDPRFIVLFGLQALRERGRRS